MHARKLSFLLCGCYMYNYWVAGPLREIVPGGTKTDTGPLAFGALVETCIVF